MAKKILVLSALAGIVVAGIWFATRSQAPLEKEMTEPSPAAISSVTPGNSGVSARAATPSAGLSPKPPSDPESFAQLAPPSARDLRREVEKDPESPPPSVVQFGMRLFHATQNALQSEERATSFFPTLEKCTLDLDSQSVSQTARVLCLSEAEKLAKKYPSLAPRFQTLERQADPKVVEIKKSSNLEK